MATAETVTQVPRTIVQLNATLTGGGAARVARNLFGTYRSRGHRSLLVVGQGDNSDPGVRLLASDLYRSRWSAFWKRVAAPLQPFERTIRGAWRIRRLIALGLGQPRRFGELRAGREDFDYPGTRHLFDVIGKVPDILHAHNLHGGYFDLRLLPIFSRQVPVLLTLHDAWLLGGHCAHAVGCDLWRTGCRVCPDLAAYPAIARDAAHTNWKGKAQILRDSRYAVATPSRWLMEKVSLSMAHNSAVEFQVIPNGVDLDLFRVDQEAGARELLGLPRDAVILITAGCGARSNPWKDFPTLRKALGEVVTAASSTSLVMLLVLGEEGAEERVGNCVVRYLPYREDPVIVARYLNAADLYLHAARADTFPNTVIESLACGTPVVCTAVGGIPEQVRSLLPWEGVAAHLNGATGVLVAPRDHVGIAHAVLMLMRDRALRQRLAQNAREDACRRFGLERQADAYLQFYERLIERQKIAGFNAI